MNTTGDLTAGAMTRREILNTAQEVLDTEASSIMRMAQRIDKSFEDAIDILYNCKGRVVVTGMGKSGLVGKKISATFSSTGTPSFSLHPAESVHGDSGVLTRDDVIVAISNSGETAELLQVLPLIKRLGIKMIALTGKLDSTLARKSDVVLDISVEKEACPLNLAPTASTTATLAMGDALAVCLLKRRNFSAEDFFMFHPSGTLGKKLFWKVEDLMIKGDKLPVVHSNGLFKDAINVISEKKLGLALVTDNSGRLEGILTDGDIRRTIQKYDNTSNLVVKDVMTKNPKTVEADELAAKALQVMETYSITALAILDQAGCPMGIIHVHELLKAGVA
jgi:arabinose-5-phosphate isomerase